MPATIEDLSRSARLPAEVVRRLAAFVEAHIATRGFYALVDPALEVIGGVVPRWPVLDAWNRWCRENGASFFVWRPVPDEPSDRERFEALMHTAMMMAAKERNTAQYRRASLTEAEIVMAGDDCVVCDEHRHHIVGLDPPAMEQLPPFHPGCRCGTVPSLS
jgi:hypothetical protein